MNQRHTPILLMAIAVPAALGLLLFQTRLASPTAPASAEVEAARKETVSALKALDQSQETVAMLESKLTEVADVLARTTDKLQETSAQLAALQAPQGTPTNGAPALAEGKAAINSMAPPVALKKIEFKETFFDSVPDAEGKELLSKATFTGMTGRRLIFRPQQGPPTTLDVDQVHPQVLAMAGVDADAAKQAQYELDLSKKAQAEAAQKAYQKQQATVRKLQEQLAARQRELAREAEEKRRIDEERAMKLEALNIERQKAQAALRNADAAMVRAMNAVPVLVGGTFVAGTNTVAPPAAGSPQTQPSHNHADHHHHAQQPQMPAGSGNFRFLPAAPTLPSQTPSPK